MPIFLIQSSPEHDFDPGKNLPENLYHVARRKQKKTIKKGPQRCGPFVIQVLALSV
jgi:hypothetical protein